MKYLLIITIIVGSGIVGKTISEKYKSRVKFYNNLIKFANLLNLNIYSLNEGVIGIIDKFCSENSETLKYDYLKIKKLIISGLSRNDIKNLKMCRELNDIEIDEVYGFFNILGKNNFDLQISLIEKYLCIFNNRLEETKIDLKQKGSISYKLSICAGVMLTILLI